jgi:hypothetical protein
MDQGGPVNSMWVVRWVLVALTAVLATILVLRGNVLVGVVLAAIAISRAILFTRLYHRRSLFRERMAARRRFNDL